MQAMPRPRLPLRSWNIITRGLAPGAGAAPGSRRGGGVDAHTSLAAARAWASVTQWAPS